MGCNGQGLFGTPTFVRYSAKHLKVVSELLNCEMSLFVRVGGSRVRFSFMFGIFGDNKYHQKLFPSCLVYPYLHKAA